MGKPKQAPQVFSAPTEAAALQEAVKALGLPREQLEYEVVDPGRQGMLGLLSRPAKIKVWPRELEPKEEKPKSVNGAAAVVDGKLQIIPPEEGGEWPRLIPTPHLRLYIDGEPQEKPISLQGNEEITVELDETEASWSATVELSPDGLEAYLVIEATPGYRYKLQDQEPHFRLELIAIAEEIPPQPWDVASLQRLVAEHGIVYGLDQGALTQAAETLVSSRLKVAQGDPPLEPQDERIEFMGPLKKDQPQLEELTESERIDYYELYQVPAVEEGEVLAVKHPGRPGVPGRKVTGEKIIPREAKERQLRAGKGALLIEGGNQVIAAVSGKPTVGGGVIKVLPVHTVQGDVDLSVGNIRFTGHVEVRGNVNENLEIDAKGQVNISGIVSSAVIVGHEGITIGKSVIASRLYAGQVSKIYSEALPHLTKLVELLPRLIQAIELLQRKAKELDQDIPAEREAYFARTLIGQKFMGVERACRELEGVLEQTPSEEDEGPYKEIQKLTAGLRHLLIGKGAATPLSRILTHSESILNEFQAGMDNAADIRAHYVQNSYLEATGTIYVAKACYNSTLTAGQGVEMETGAFRGGALTVNEGNVKIGELGSPNEASTNVVLIKGGLIKASIIHPNVRVTIGRESHRFTRQSRSVTIYIDKQGQLQVSYG
ncbi:MAG: flagellar assembly protein A [Limnochordia bacterium]